MLTPQDVQKVSFDRALFGGYNMQQVDEFLQPLSEDYISLYQENVVLKSKLRVLADTLHEYQVRESVVDAAHARAQREAELLRQKTQDQCDRMLAEAEAEVKARLKDLLEQLEAEQTRVNAARRASGDFVTLLEQTVAQQLTTLRLLRSMSLQEMKSGRQLYDDAQQTPALPDPPAPMSEADVVRIGRTATRLLREVGEQTRPASEIDTENFHLRGEQPNHATGL